MNYELFSVLSRPFQPELLEKALNVQTIQMTQAAYNLAVSRLKEEVRQHLPNSDVYFTLLDNLGDIIVEELGKCIVPGGVQRTWMPLITRVAISEWLGDLASRMVQGDQRTRANVVISAIAAFFYEVRDLWIVAPRLRDWGGATSSVEFSSEFQSYAFWKTIEARKTENTDIFGTRETLEAFVAEQTKRVDQMLMEQGTRTIDMQTMFSAAHDDTNEMVSKTKAALNEYGERLQKLTEETDASETKIDTLTRMIETTGSQVSAFATSVREELKIDTTKKLWGSRAFWNAASFWTSAAVIALAILVPPTWALYHIETVLAFLKRVGDAATQGLPPDATNTQLTAATISRLVVITAPLALYFWAVKLLVRFNTRSMMLMDDARQRQTTLDTYFHLIERSVATTEERGLMLNALFRPLPGQGQDNVEPPNFMELVKKD